MAQASYPPQHVAIIMDGNGRWAKERGLPRLKGHEEGARSVRAALHSCRRHGVHYLTLYAFSMENWVRPRPEISGLMQLLHTFLTRNEHELHDNEVQFRTIGRLGDLPKRVRKQIDRVTQSTANHRKGQLTLALSYGGRSELTDAVRRIAQEVAEGSIQPTQIDEQMVGQYLYDPDLPDPDLLIRTSGEMRLSNFLLWQISYSELYMTDVYWPDFRDEAFDAAMEEYKRRHRRFGDIA